MRIWNGTEQPLYDVSRERELMDILGIQSMDEDAFDFFAYENGVYSHQVDGAWFDLPKRHILGWAYPISEPKV